MRKMTYAEGIREGMRIRMQEDDSVIIFGEDVGQFGGCFGVTAGMFEEFSGERVKDTPISEGVIIGSAVGAAATGLKPIAELMFVDFATVGMDQLVNQAAKMRYMFGGKIGLPMVVRLPGGAGTRAAAQHSQSLESWLTHVPGLKLVYPSNAEDAAGLMLSAIDDDNPVIYFEHKVLYAMEGEVPDKIEPIPFGKAKVKREGSDVTILTYAKQVYDSLEAAKQLEAEGVDVEVIDLRSLYPLDKEAIEKSIKKTNKVVLVSEEVKRGGYIGEIAAMISEDFFYELDAPIVRVGTLNVPIPFSPVLEDYVVPRVEDIVNAVKKLV
ncbi:MAG: alpha-ketoacid dehydrogenase subunit beta [Tissierellales bacterium]|jgi:pyruvate dehydrogenase E1 component beta subunit|nr:alpha-ketoacid dehydrogenase subunit beta [Tissierellales bacterium]